jgi:multidrug efflux pump subunit AcrA (membrane-fusion protein)
VTATEPRPATPETTDAVESAPPAAPTKRRHVALLGLAAVVLLGALLTIGILPRLRTNRQLASSVAQASAALAAVTASEARRPTAPATVVIPGTMEALHEAAVYARVPGYVRRWYKDLGAPVRAGELLAVLDVPELEQNVLQGRAQLAQLRSAQVLAKANYDRWRLLIADSAVTLLEYQQMLQTYQAATANVTAAEASLRGLETLALYSRITAPFDGVVTARNVDNGALVSAAGASSTPLSAGGSAFTSSTTMAAASLFHVAQMDTMRVYVSVPQLYVSSISPGLHADVRIDDLGGRSLPGIVARTSRAIDATTRTLLAEVDVPNIGLIMVPGMNARVILTFRRIGAPLAIPSTALVVRTAGPQVMQLLPARGDTATIHFLSVQVARDDGSTVEIVSGLPDEARVVTIGTLVLTEGQKVVVRQPADSTKKGAPAQQKKP